MGLWLESFLKYDGGIIDADGTPSEQERQARHILAYLAMAVPRSIRNSLLENGLRPRGIYMAVLRGALGELRKVPELSARVSYGLLLAVAFIDDEQADPEERFGTCDTHRTVQEFTARAEEVLRARPDLQRLGARMAELDNTEGSPR